MISQVFTLLITIVITNSSYNNGHTFQHHRHLPIQHTPLSWVDWKKISPTMRQHSSKQLHTGCCYIHHNESKHSHCIEFVPLASSVESMEIRTTCTARPSNIFHIFSNTTPEQRRSQRLSPGRFDIRLTSRAPARLPSCCISHITF